ncbi:hypothetical protein AYO41_02035 [Verrucomicrobia bacterium SCGC AG-212-E04]|nr:hypothetical protein AYO41_02035 [Verrucomicrobia bacterium SCGC AG-212-E04]
MAKTHFAAFNSLSLPIVLAPMASGATTPALVAAVADAGGLACLACAMHAPVAMDRDVAEIRRLTKRPFAVNLFILPALSQPDPQAVAAAIMSRLVAELTAAAQRANRTSR